MSTRHIPIESCLTCPHRDHKGAFGSVAYVPCCRKADCDLPYTTSTDSRHRAYANPTNVIPGWCPLPVLKESATAAERCKTCGSEEPFTGSCGTSDTDTKALCKRADSPDCQKCGGEGKLLSGYAHRCSGHCDRPCEIGDGNLELVECPACGGSGNVGGAS